ncbi:MAG TPA: prolyl oligopeptidase family serine peptidase, partial [Myxococcota bacterium]|nr:prolyl oligopeptidase family serine peptidase [Myxococcota bacterium]
MQTTSTFTGGVFGLGLLACLPFLGCDEGGGPDPDALPFEPAGPASVPDPGAPGPFPVGVMTLDLVDESRTYSDTGEPRRLKTEVYYPATAAARDGPFMVYDLKDEITPENVGADNYAIMMAAELPIIPTQTVRDAEPDKRHGPYPVILYSHGANGMRWQSFSYTIHLASHGYVVISPDHERNLLWDILKDGWDPSAVAVSAPMRIDDATFLLDHFLDRAQTEGDFFQGLLNRRQVGISGHSFGGWTTLVMLCQDIRFKVGVAHAPEIGLAYPFCACDVQSNTCPDFPKPVMVQGGTLDSTLRYRDQYCGYRSFLGDQPKYLVEILDGGHFTFSDICRLNLLSLDDALVLGEQARDALEDGCGPDNLPWDDAMRIINHYSVAMFNVYLRESPGTQAELVQRQD